MIDNVDNSTLYITLVSIAVSYSLILYLFSSDSNQYCTAYYYKIEHTRNIL